MARLQRLGAAVLVTLLLVGLLPAAPAAQSAVTAQILSFWRLLSVGGTFSGVTLAYATLAIQANGYANFGTVRGATGYGVRDNNGTIEFKNDGGSWGAAAGGASPTATFLVQSATSAPANAQIMASLGTGLVFNTTGTGVQSTYTGTFCTNQFTRSLSAIGAAGCASVNLSSDVTGLLAATSFPALTGDITTSAGALATTLVDTAVTPTSYGSSTRIATFTVDSKGRLTAAASVIPQLTLTSTYFSSLSAANLTGIPISGLSGLLPAGNFPALTGDVTNTGGTLATTVGSIGGSAIALGGAFTLSGSNPVTLTSTGSTSLTLPTSGTLLTTAVTALASLSTVGTISTGVWQGTAIGAAYGGTGLTTVTAHAIMVGEGTAPVYPLPGCTTGVPWWSVSSVDPTCTGSPLLISPGFLTRTVLGGTGAAAGATTNSSITKLVTGIADATVTPVLTVTIPNAASAGVVHVRVVGSIGAGGAVGAFECSATLDGTVVVARTTTLATVATASTASLTANSCVVGATTITLAYSVSSISGATAATQTFAVNVTITKGGGSSANHSAVVYAEILNANQGGLTIS